MIGSKNALYQIYALYLLGLKYGFKHNELKSTIARCFVFGILTRRYTSSPESIIELELSNFIEQDNIIEYLEDIMASELTNDFWEVTLPQRLNVHVQILLNQLILQVKYLKIIMSCFQRLN